MQPAATLTRRSVLALTLLTIAGCRHKTATPPPPSPTPDASALADARAAEQQLVAMYDAQLAAATGDAADTLTVARDTHAAHLTALGGEVDVTATATPASPPFGRADALLRRSASTLRTAAIGAVDGGDAALFASIAASHAVSAG